MHVLALPLAYIYARKVLVLSSARPDKAAFAAFLEWARTRATGACCSSASGGTDLLSHRYGVEPLASERFQVPEYDAAARRLPALRPRQGVRLRRVRVHAAAAGEPGMASTSISASATICTCCASMRRRQADGRTIRWTRATSYVIGRRRWRASARDGDAVDEQRRAAGGGAPASVTVLSARASCWAR